MFVASDAGISQLATGRFSGFGNDVPLPDEDVVTRVNQGQWWIQPAVGWAIRPTTEVKFGPVVKFTRTDSTPNSVVAELQPYGFSRFGQAGLMLSLVHESEPREFHGSSTDRIMRADPLHTLEGRSKRSVLPWTLGREVGLWFRCPPVVTHT
jgi:hypothetical protein